MILADTDVLIDFLTGIQPVAKQVEEYIKAEQMQTTAVNSFELLSGAGDNKRGRAVRQLVDSLAILPLDRSAAELAAAIRRELERTGQPIGMGDSLIAGIALAHSLPLFTRNRTHFERVANLELIKVSGAKR